MFTQFKSAISPVNRLLNKRLAPGIWIVCLLALFTVSHLALISVERTNNLGVVRFQNSTLERLIQKLMISDRSMCGTVCASDNADEGLTVTDGKTNESEVVEKVTPQPEGEENEDEYVTLPERAIVSHPEQYQKDVAKRLNKAWTDEMSATQEAVLQNRSSAVKNMCGAMKLTGALSPKMRQVFENMRFITKHNMIWCPIFKAASTTWVKNLLMIAGETKVQMKSLHARVRQLYGQPADPRVRDKYVKDFEKMLIVRHPLERLLSAYRDKMLRVRHAHDPHVKLQQEIIRLYPDPNAPSTLKPTKSGKDKVYQHPTFTQFLMKVRDDVLKAWSSDGSYIVNMHWRPVWLTCAPCQIPYDFIAKVETLDLDQEYIIRHMGLQDVLYNAHTHSSNFDSYNTTSDAAKDYFKHVPHRLLRDVVELYQPDFTLFNYSPNAYLEMAIPGDWQQGN